MKHCGMWYLKQNKTVSIKKNQMQSKIDWEYLFQLKRWALQSAFSSPLYWFWLWMYCELVQLKMSLWACPIKNVLIIVSSVYIFYPEDVCRTFSNYTLYALDNALMRYENVLSYSTRALENTVFSWHNEVYYDMMSSYCSYSFTTSVNKE